MDFGTATPIAGPAVRLVRNARQLAAVRRSLGLDPKAEGTPVWADTEGTAGLTWTFELEGAQWHIVYVADHEDPADTVSVLAHEAHHVMRAHMRFLSEHEPGEEHEAYTLQSIVKVLITQMRRSVSHSLK